MCTAEIRNHEEHILVFEANVGGKWMNLKLFAGEEYFAVTTTMLTLNRLLNAELLSGLCLVPIVAGPSASWMGLW